MPWVRRFVLPLGLFALGLVAQAAPPSVAGQNEVRVLIDVSASMKKNDPQNLRAPALRLFTTLMPNGTVAGLWTFGAQVNNILPVAPVDAVWKDKARTSADKIHSLGRYTNIEDTLHDATWDWRRPVAGARRSVILLTDGWVDIAKDPARNQAARARILEKQLPALVQAGVKVYTVALSADADHGLLEQLAAATGARYERVDNAQALERLFLRLFDQVAQADTVPLADNRATVDKSIKEITFLVFRKEGAEPTRLVAPDRTRFGRAEAPANVRWHQDDRYDLVTVDQPAPGEWQVLAAQDGDNRVTVVTDLKLRSAELPEVLGAYAHYAYAARLETAGKVLSTPDLLRFVTVTLHQYGAKGAHHSLTLLDDGTGADSAAHDGIYTTVLGPTLVAGAQDMVLEVDGTTFKRETRKRVMVYEFPVSAAVRPARDQPHQYDLTVLAYSSLVNAQDLVIEAEITAPNGVVNRFEVPRVSAAAWQQVLDVRDAPGAYRARVHYRGTLVSGDPVDHWLENIAFGAGAASPPPAAMEAAPAPVPAAAEPEAPVPPAAEEPAAPEPTKAAPAVATAPPDAEPKPKDASSAQAEVAAAAAAGQGGGLSVLLWVGIGLLVAGGAGAVAYGLRRRKRATPASPAPASASPATPEQAAAEALLGEPLDFDDPEPEAAPVRAEVPLIPELDELLDGPSPPTLTADDEIAAIPDDLLDLGPGGPDKR